MKGKQSEMCVASGKKKLASEMYLSIRLFSKENNGNFSMHRHWQGIWMKEGICWTLHRNEFYLQY